MTIGKLFKFSSKPKQPGLSSSIRLEALYIWTHTNKTTFIFATVSIESKPVCHSLPLREFIVLLPLLSLLLLLLFWLLMLFLLLSLITLYFQKQKAKANRAPMTSMTPPTTDTHSSAKGLGPKQSKRKNKIDLLRIELWLKDGWSEALSMSSQLLLYVVHEVLSAASEGHWETSEASGAHLAASEALPVPS